MSKIAETLAALDPAPMGRPSKLDGLLDDDDRKMLVDRYVAGCSVRTLMDAMNTAWKKADINASITENPIIDLLKREGVYRTR